MSGAAAWRGKLYIPEHAHPLVRQLVEILNKKKLTFTELARAAGITGAALASWRYRHNPRIDNFEAALNALGYELQIVPREPQKTVFDVKQNGLTVAETSDQSAAH